MKVALLVPGGLDPSGEYRVIPCLLWLVERLAQVHEVHVFALRQAHWPPRYRLLGAEVHHIGFGLRRSRAAAAVLAEHMRSAFDVLHAVWTAPQGVLAATLGALLRRPAIVHVTGGDLVALPDVGFGLLRSRRGAAWLGLATRGARRVTVPSRYMQELAAARGIRADVLPFGVALDRWPPAPVRPRVGGAPARLLQIADLNPVKDQTTLLEAAARLRAAGRAFHLDIVGADTLGGAVQRRTASLGLGDEITFHGFLPHRSLRPIVEGADLLIVSSRHEADPTVLLEAAVAGVPTVGTAVGHIRDWAPEAAVAVPVGDSEALAAAIQDVLADEARRRRLAEAAQRRAVVRDADWTARRVTEIYRELCNV